MTDAPQDERCTRFADYLVDNYVTAESRYPQVPWTEVPQIQSVPTILPNFFMLISMSNFIHPIHLYLCSWMY